MLLQGIKVRTIEPGTVVVADWIDGDWNFTVVVNGVPIRDDVPYHSTSAAKQAMREEVARLRRIHLPE